MAQAVIKRPSASSQNLPVTTWAAIAGLSATLLTGSGWINLSFSAFLVDTSAAPNECGFQFYLDGIPIQNTARKITVPASANEAIAFSTIIKAGSGQHTFEVWGYSLGTNAHFVSWNAEFIIQEPGY